MATFKDSQPRDWIVALDAPKIRAVRAECGVNLADLGGSAYEAMAEDPCILFDVLWVLCRSQAEARNLNSDQFGELLVGETIERATAAMLESIADFFQKSKRELLLAIAQKNKRIRELGTAKALEKINNPELEAKAVAALEADMDEVIRKALMRSPSATGSPVSSESTPAA